MKTQLKIARAELRGRQVDLYQLLQIARAEVRGLLPELRVESGAGDWRLEVLLSRELLSDSALSCASQPFSRRNFTARNMAS